MFWGNIYFYSSIDVITSHANNVVVKKLLYNVWDNNTLDELEIKALRKRRD